MPLELLFAIDTDDYLLLLHVTRELTLSPRHDDDRQRQYVYWFRRLDVTLQRHCLSRHSEIYGGAIER